MSLFRQSAIRNPQSAMVLLFSFLFSLSASADVLYDRLDMTDNETWDTTNGSSITLWNGGWDRQTADDFELDGTYEITSVIGDLSHWTDQPPSVVPADGFLVEFFPNETENCVTGPPPCPTEVPFVAVFAPEFTATLLDVTTPGGGWPIHRFEVDLTGSGIILGPGIWWASLVAVDESGQPSSLLAWSTFIEVDLPEGVAVQTRAAGEDHGNGYQGGTQPDWRPFPFSSTTPGDAAIRIEGTPVNAPVVLYDTTDMTDNQTYDNSHPCLIGGFVQFGEFRDEQAADDFELTDTYLVTSVTGDFLNFTPGAFPAGGVLVEFFSDLAGTPSEVASSAALSTAVIATPFTDTVFGNHGVRLTVDLKIEGITLSPGTWWVSIVPVDETSSGVSYAHIRTTSGPIVGNPGHVRDGGLDHGNGYPGGAYGTNDWWPSSTVGLPNGNLAMKIEGVLVVACENDADCDDGDACTIDTCDVKSGDCANEPIECGAGEVCEDGKCVTPDPPVIDSVEPASLVLNTVPQPDIDIAGSNMVIGLPSETNHPTVTFTHADGPEIAELTVAASVNVVGTVATVDSTNLFHNAPLGSYDVTVTRPDGGSATAQDAFAITDGSPAPGEVALLVRSVWGGPVFDVDLVGDLAYVANGRALRILNIADPADIIELGSLYIPSGVAGVAVSGGYAFLAANKPYRFCVVDVSDPTAPTLVSVGQGGQFPRTVHLYGSLAYVFGNGGTGSSGSNPIEVFDVSDPLNVVAQGSLGSVGSVRAKAFSGDLLYVGGGDIAAAECDPPQEGCAVQAVELRIFDLAADPLNLPLLGSVITNLGEGNGDGGPVNGGQSAALSVEGNYAVWIIQDDNNGFPAVTYSFRVVDVSDPAAPVIVGSHTNDDGALSFSEFTDVVLSGGLAYVADAAVEPQYWAGAKGLAVFDIATDPANPTIISTFKTHGNVSGVEVFGNRAYLHDDGEGLIILNITDPHNPVRLGNYHSPALLRQIEKDGDLMYVADAWNGFTVLDVGNPDAPEVVSVYFAEHVEDIDPCNGRVSAPLGVNAWGIEVRDDLVYLGAGHLGLEIVDVSDVFDLIFLGAFRVPDPRPSAGFAAVTLSGDVAHVGYGKWPCGTIQGWFLNLNISDPADIFELGRVSHGVPRASRITLNPQGIAFLGGQHPIFGGGLELTIDTSTPANPSVLRFGDINPVADVALDGEILYLAGGGFGGNPDDGLYVQDVTDPAHPIQLLHLDASVPLGEDTNLAIAYALVQQNQRLYVAGRGCITPTGCGRGGLYLFDVADPATPVLLDAVPDVSGSRSNVTVDEPYVYATSEFEGPNAVNYGLVILETVAPSLCPADLDGNGAVGAFDLALLLGNWGPCDGDCPADLDDSGAVGAFDLALLLGSWGPCE